MLLVFAAEKPEQVFGRFVILRQTVVENRESIPANRALYLLLAAALAQQQPHSLAIHRVLRFQLTYRERRRGGFSQGSAPRISILGPGCPA